MTRVSIEFQERRRSPRIASPSAQEFRLGRRVRVRIIDISASGALIAAEEALPVGTKGRLQVLLGSEQFEGQMEVVREHVDPGRRGPLMGVTITPSQPRHREVLERFLRRAGN